MLRFQVLKLSGFWKLPVRFLCHLFFTGFCAYPGLPLAPLVCPSLLWLVGCDIILIENQWSLGLTSWSPKWSDFCKNLVGNQWNLDLTKWSQEIAILNNLFNEIKWKINEIKCRKVAGWLCTPNRSGLLHLFSCSLGFRSFANRPHSFYQPIAYCYYYYY